MALALPRESPNSNTSRQGSDVLADADCPLTEPVITASPVGSAKVGHPLIDRFCRSARPQTPGGRTAVPAAFRQPLMSPDGHLRSFQCAAQRPAQPGPAQSLAAFCHGSRYCSRWRRVFLTSGSMSRITLSRWPVLSDFPRSGECDIGRLICN